VIPGIDEAEYKRLLVEQPPLPIDTRADLERMERWIWQLLEQEQRTPAEEAYLSVLTTLVRAWEDEHVVIPALAPRELIKALLEERGQRQRDLVPIFGTESIVSEVLSGKRHLRLEHLPGLADFFHVPASVFIETAPASHGLLAKPAPV
jgi:HTH-type transcriptional regulator/antitoxin HigA